MFLRDLGASLLRRWYLVVIGVGATVGLSFLAGSLIQPTYESKASLVLVPPATTVGKTGNPYLFLGGLQQSTDILARAMNSDEVHRNVALSAPTGKYVVETDLGTSAPIIELTATDGTSAGTRRMLDATVAQVPITFQKLQTSLGVRTGALITTDVVTRFDKPKPIQAVRYRTIVLVTVASLGVFFMLIGLIDGLLLRRRARKDLAAEAAAEAAEVEAPAPVVDASEPVAQPVRRPAKKRAPRKAPAVTVASSARRNLAGGTLEEPAPVVEGGEPETESKPKPRPARKRAPRKTPAATTVTSEEAAVEEEVPVVDGATPDPVANEAETDTTPRTRRGPVKANRPVKKVRGSKAKVGATAAVNDKRSTAEGTDERNSRGDIGD